jgi:hypothetical protein
LGSGLKELLLLLLRTEEGLRRLLLLGTLLLLCGRSRLEGEEVAGAVVELAGRDAEGKADKQGGCEGPHRDCAKNEIGLIIILKIFQTSKFFIDL